MFDVMNKISDLGGWSDQQLHERNRLTVLFALYFASCEGDARFHKSLSQHRARGLDSRHVHETQASLGFERGFELAVDDSPERTGPTTRSPQRTNFHNVIGAVAPSATDAYQNGREQCLPPNAHGSKVNHNSLCRCSRDRQSIGRCLQHQEATQNNNNNKKRNPVARAGHVLPIKVSGWRSP
ncbi:unnamed protein product [Ixodes pacificus]